MNSTAPVPVAGSVEFIMLAAGWNHTCRLTNSGTVSCWGDNLSGQLGPGTFNYATVPIAVVPL